MSVKSECSTKAKRAELVRQLAELAAKHNATIETTIEDSTGKHILIAKGPYRVSTWLDGRTCCGAFLGHWHTALDSGAKYSPEFAVTIGGSINTYHFAKATTCEETWEGFKRSLAAGFAAL